MRIAVGMAPMLALAASLLAGRPAAAHPGVGVVIDSRANVFYTDLKATPPAAP